MVLIMKSIKILAVFIFMINIVKAENEDSFKTAVVENQEPDVLNVSLTHYNDTNFINTTNNFMVNLKPTDKTSFVLHKRDQRKLFVPKFQLKQKNKSEELKRSTPRRFMEASESRQEKVVTSPPPTSVTTQKNYKIKDLLKNQKYIPRVERRKMPVLTLEGHDGNNGNTRRNYVAPVDHTKSVFIRRKATAMNPDEDKLEVAEPVDELKSRQERSINIIEEERVPTTSGTKFSAKDWPMSPEFTYKNIHS